MRARLRGVDRARRRGAALHRRPGLRRLRRVRHLLRPGPARPAQFAAWPAYPGLMDRAQQPFEAAGLDVPSYVALGNHDALVQGNQAANAAFNAVAHGLREADRAALSPATRAGLLETMLRTSPQSTVIVPPDPDRAPIDQAPSTARCSPAQATRTASRSSTPTSSPPPAAPRATTRSPPPPGLRFIGARHGRRPAASPARRGRQRRRPAVPVAQGQARRGRRRPTSSSILFSHHGPDEPHRRHPGRARRLLRRPASRRTPAATPTRAPRSRSHLEDDVVELLLGPPARDRLGRRATRTSTTSRSASRRAAASGSCAPRPRPTARTRTACSS